MLYCGYMKNKTLWIVVGVVVIIGLYVVGTYNSLVGAGNGADVQWAQVETSYQRRFDLIPGLVASVQGVLNQEDEIFTALAEARTRYSGAVASGAPVGERVAAANQVESAIGRLLVVVENYPNLQSSQVMRDFMAQQEGTENRINVERSRFNEMVGRYNLKTKRFPSSIVASMFGFEARELFQAAAGSENAVKVEFAE